MFAPVMRFGLILCLLMPSGSEVIPPATPGGMDGVEVDTPAFVPPSRTRSFSPPRH